MKLLKTIFVLLFITILPSFCKPESLYEQGQRIISNYWEAEDLASVQTSIANITEYKKNISLRQRLMALYNSESKIYPDLLDDVYLCEIPLFRSLFRYKRDPFVLDEAKNMLRDAFGEKALNKALKKMRLSEEKELLNMGQEAARRALLDQILDLIEKHPKIMLNQEVFEWAIHNYEYSTHKGFKGYDHISDFFNFTKSFDSLMALHNHCKKNNCVHATSLHDFLNHFHPNYKVVEWFLQNGYDPNFKDSKGRTALDVIYQKVNRWNFKGMPEPHNADVECVQTLKKYGAKFGSKIRAKWAIFRGLHSFLREDHEIKALSELKELMQDIDQI